MCVWPQFVTFVGLIFCEFLSFAHTYGVTFCDLVNVFGTLLALLSQESANINTRECQHQHQRVPTSTLESANINTRECQHQHQRGLTPRECCLMSKETYSSVKRDLHQCQKRPTLVSKETYTSVKRDLHQCQKRPTLVSNETYTSVKRDRHQCQKRPTLLRHQRVPTLVSKETYTSVKRDLHQCQKRPTLESANTTTALSWHKIVLTLVQVSFDTSVGLF